MPFFDQIFQNAVRKKLKLFSFFNFFFKETKAFLQNEIVFHCPFALFVLVKSVLFKRGIGLPLQCLCFYSSWPNRKGLVSVRF